MTAGAATTFTGEKTAWHGFDRYDFLMDQENLTIKPIKAAADENNGIKTQVKGQWRCVVVVPKEAAPGNPWSWRGYYFDHEPQAEVELLKRGFHIGFIQSDAGKPWDAWYTFLTEKHGLSRKPAFIGMSRGGCNAFTWATTHPDKVSCIYADNPAISRDSLMKLGGLAKNDVPLLHVCGSLDPILGKHTLVIENIYQQLGGRISVMIKEGAGHHPHSLRDPTPIADFIVQSLQPAGGSPPAFVGKKFTRSAYYGVENSYRDFPKEGTYITCRGPWFTGCYDRYEFRLDGIKGAVTVIVPRTAAPGKPVGVPGGLRRPGRRGRSGPAGQGFHIVTGPVPTDTNGPVLQQWNAVYKHLTDHGFSKKPVMEGAGGAAGEAYAWAIANPDKVSCIYGENPVLRSHMSKTQPLDNLAVAGQGRRAAPARLRQPRPLVQRADARRGEALQGTRRPDHGHRQGRRGTLSARTEGPAAGGGFHHEECRLIFIDANLGVPWIPPRGVQDFAADLFHVARPRSRSAVWRRTRPGAARPTTPPSSRFTFPSSTRGRTGPPSHPSPTAEATRLTEPDRTSPAANTPGRLVSSRNGVPPGRPVGDCARAGPVRTNPLASVSISGGSQSVRGTAPMKLNSAGVFSVRASPVLLLTISTSPRWPSPDIRRTSVLRSTSMLGVCSIRRAR